MLETDLPFVSLWYAIGGEYTDRDGDWQMTAGDRARSVIIASEPLTTDHSSWLEVPEYSMLTAELTRRRARVRGRATWMPDRETVDVLAARPALRGQGARGAGGAGEGVAPARRCARARSSGARGTTRGRWCSSSRASVSASLRVVGGRAVEIARAGPGEMVGEIALIDGGPHTMSVNVTEDGDPPRARPAGLHRAARPPAPVGVQPQAPPRVALRRAPAQPAPAPRRPARRRGGRPAGRGSARAAPTSSTAARPTAPTCVAWRPSTTSTGWRSGAS